MSNETPELNTLLNRVKEQILNTEPVYYKDTAKLVVIIEELTAQLKAHPQALNEYLMLGHALAKANQIAGEK